MSGVWSSKSVIVVVAVLAGLAIVFALDDWLILLLVRELELGIASDLALLLAGGVITVGNVLLALAVYQAMKKRPVSGAEGLVGEVGEAVRSFRSAGQVRVHGEIWKAVTDRPVRKGQKVRVMGINGLELRVSPESGDRVET